MGLSKISIWRGEMDMQKSIKSLKRNGILLLAYDLLVLCIVFVKNGMINMSAEAVTSLIVSIGFGIFINLLWIVDSKTWITDYGKRKCIWSYWCGEIVLLSVVSSCFGKYESTGCNICHIGNDGGISYNWYMVGEP